jgi:hypothetical protein
MDILGNVQQRFQGGRAGQGDEQTNRTLTPPRLRGPSSAQPRRRTLEIPQGHRHRAVQPAWPGRLAGLPGSKDILAVTLTDNQPSRLPRQTRMRRVKPSTGGRRLHANVALEARAPQGHAPDSRNTSAKASRSSPGWISSAAAGHLETRRDRGARTTRPMAPHACSATPTIGRQGVGRTRDHRRPHRQAAAVDAERLSRPIPRNMIWVSVLLIDLLNAENRRLMRRFR